MEEMDASDDIPENPAERDKYFIEQMNKGEQAMKIGPNGYSKAAKHFFNAIKVYPNPQELLAALRSSIPDTLFMEIMKLIQEEFRKSESESSILD